MRTSSTIFAVAIWPSLLCAHTAAAPLISLLETVRAYGYDKDMKTVPPCPIGLPCMKVLYTGVVCWLLFPMQELMPFIHTTASKDKLDIDEVINKIETMTGRP